MRAIDRITAPAFLLQTSEHLRALRLLRAKEGNKSRLFGAGTRPLGKREIARLEKQGNRAADWSRIRVSIDFLPDCIHDNLFLGECFLGRFQGSEIAIAEGTGLASGIYRSTLKDVEVGDEALVHQAGMIDRYLLKAGAAVVCTGRLACPAESRFGNGRRIPLCLESGGREIPLFAEMSLELAAAATERRGDAELQESVRELTERYAESCALPFGVLEAGSRVCNTVKVIATYLGEGAVIDGAQLVEDTTLLSGPAEAAEVRDGAVVRGSILQWGARVTTLAIVEDSLLCERSLVDRHAQVRASLIGPNTEIAEGEVTSSLVGPFVGFHHQALLIAAFWPEGRGNVGYGANIGSNHTSKAPDQEIRCGEGTFFGLGASVRFPANFEEAPYTLIATGVTTLPQKVEFPFSLITQPFAPAPGLPPAYTEILPGWVLEQDSYMLFRNMEKHRRRNRARRSPLEVEIFRADIVAKLLKARRRLQAPAGRKAVYLEQDIPGLGKSFLLEENRVQGIAAYTRILRYWALKRLKESLSGLTGPDLSLEAVVKKQENEPAGDLLKEIIAEEGLSKAGLRECLEELPRLQEEIAAAALSCREKDDERGRRIIPGYAESHPSPSRDEIVLLLRRETETLAAEVRELLIRFC